MTSNNDLDPLLDRFLAEMLEFMPADVIATIGAKQAQRVLDTMPGTSIFRAALRDAFRDNIDSDDDTSLI